MTVYSDWVMTAWLFVRNTWLEGRYMRCRRCSAWKINLVHIRSSQIAEMSSSIQKKWWLSGCPGQPKHARDNYRLITAYLLLWVNLDKIMHARWDFDASSARTRRVSALDKHQNWSASALFCLNSWPQSKYAVVNLIHTRRKQTFLSFIIW